MSHWYSWPRNHRYSNWNRVASSSGCWEIRVIIHRCRPLSWIFHFRFPPSLVVRYRHVSRWHGVPENIGIAVGIALLASLGAEIYAFHGCRPPSWNFHFRFPPSLVVWYRHMSLWHGRPRKHRYIPWKCVDSSSGTEIYAFHGCYPPSWIFYFRFPPSLVVRYRYSPIGMADPENIDIAVGIALLASSGAVMYAFHWCRPLSWIFHFRFHPNLVVQYRSMSHWYSWPQNHRYSRWNRVASSSGSWEIRVIFHRCKPLSLIFHFRFPPTVVQYRHMSHCPIDVADLENIGIADENAFLLSVETWDNRFTLSSSGLRPPSWICHSRLLEKVFRRTMLSLRSLNIIKISHGMKHKFSEA